MKVGEDQCPSSKAESFYFIQAIDRSDGALQHWGGAKRLFSSTTVESISSLVLNLLYGPALTSLHDYWKNHGFDNTDLCC